jgi:hypothetical protein
VPVFFVEVAAGFFTGAFALFRAAVAAFAGVALYSGAQATAAAAKITPTNRQFGSFMVIRSLKNYMPIGRTKRPRT